MIKYERRILDNGLTVIAHEDKSTPLVAVNIMYDVGARDENPEKTGFAHLFEHLMFGGSINIPKYDEPLQKVGGENNAFTNNDITNYYCTLPVQNIETGFWLESDRMLDLAFSPKSLDVQRNVVSEEFKQVYLNQPYGDAWLLLRPMAYKVHPYRWPTIGKTIQHVQDANMDDVRSFYKKFYNPNNAVLVVSGNIAPDKVFALADKWFGKINNRGENQRSLPAEPIQTEERRSQVEKDVPANAIYKAWHMCARLDPEFYATDLVSDILSNGNSSRLNQKLVKEQKLFSDVHAYISGDIDKGLFIITGKLMPKVPVEAGDQAIENEIKQITNQILDTRELEKVKNKVEASLIFSETNILSKAINLAYYETIGDAEINNRLIERYRAVSTEEIRNQAKHVLSKDNCSTLYYLSKSSHN